MTNVTFSDRLFRGGRREKWRRLARTLQSPVAQFDGLGTMRQPIASGRWIDLWFLNDSMLNQPKNQRVAAILAFAGILLPGLHKFYLGQPQWGIAYLLLSWTPVSKIASAIEGFWYLFQDRAEFDRQFNGTISNSVGLASVAGFAVSELSPVQTSQTGQVSPVSTVSTIAEAVRQIEQLRQDGLISEYEFEQKRRQLLDRIH